jgi:hypothetical protein
VTGEIRRRGDEPRQIPALKAEAIRVYTAQKQLGKDAELSAAEIVRRAERGLGIAVKRGQEEGTVMTNADGPAVRDDLRALGTKIRTGDVFPEPKERRDAYSLAATPDDQFEEAITEARAEGNLSRANVVRKAAQKRIVNARGSVSTTVDADAIRKGAAVSGWRASGRPDRDWGTPPGAETPPEPRLNSFTHCSKLDRRAPGGGGFGAR